MEVRLKVLRALKRAPHRYRRLRQLTLTISLATLFVVPLTKLARVDLWGGRHFLLGRSATLKEGLAGVIVGIAAMYVITFLANLAAGRLFCGWGCPVGQISRFGDHTSVPGLKGGQRLVAHAEGAAFSAAFLLSMFAWWVDLRVFWLGSATALAWSWGLLALGTLAAWLHGRYWRWEFCMQVCPIGLYYSFVSPAKWFGIHFHADRTCIECDACNNVCPVHLAPRQLHRPIEARGGVSIADAPGHNHCLECGDCIQACEFMVARRSITSPPLTLGTEATPSWPQHQEDTTWTNRPANN